MKTTLAVLSLTALLTPVLGQAADTPITAQQYQSVLAGNWRDPANSARDGYRHPQQTLAFFGLGARQTVIEITPVAAGTARCWRRCSRITGSTLRPCKRRAAVTTRERPKQI